MTKSGFSTVLATNGREAIAAYDPEKIAAVVLDLIMPDIEGIETLTKLRRSFPKVKVLAISGGGQIGAKDYLDLAAKLGANATLAKPFTPEALMTELQRVLGTN